MWIRIIDSDSNPQLFVLPIEDPIPRRLQHTLLHNIKFQFTIIHFLSQIPIYFYIFTPQYHCTAFGLIQPKSSIKYKCNAGSPMEKETLHKNLALESEQLLKGCNWDSNEFLLVYPYVFWVCEFFLDLFPYLIFFLFSYFSSQWVLSSVVRVSHLNFVALYSSVYSKTHTAERGCSWLSFLMFVENVGNFMIVIMYN